jgi:hypothetical protein
MYKIIGADQREYGPVTADQIRQWIREGRANANTLCQAEGSTGFRAISTFPEFGFAQAVPPMSSVPPQYATTTTNSYAVTGLVCGILTFMCPCFSCFTGIAGVIFSCIALAQTSGNPLQKGKGMAIAGLVLSVAGLLFWTGIGTSGWLPHSRHIYRHWNI